MQKLSYKIRKDDKKKPLHMRAIKFKRSLCLHPFIPFFIQKCRVFFLLIFEIENTF